MITLMQAIARMEGFGADPENIPTRHNNPGDICAGQFANAHGAIPGAVDPKYAFMRTAGLTVEPSRYAVFPHAVTGWEALRALLAAHYLGMSVRAAIEKYAPATENDTEAYVCNVCEWTGLRPYTIIDAAVIG